MGLCKSISQRSDYFICKCKNEKKRERVAKQQEFENTIENLEKQHKQTSNPQLLNKIKDAPREYNSLIADKIKGNLRFINQRYYEHGNRASRLLAIRFRKQRSSNIVKKIKSSHSINPLTKPNEIAESFADFYKSLYKNSDTCSDDNILAAFLNNIKFNELTETMAKDLDELIKESEIIETISTLKNNKSPGPNGYINEFYKNFKELVSPLLLGAYHYALQFGTVVPSWRYATIVVIHKEGKDPAECQSYRPISLLNSDLRILTAILAKRVNRLISQILHLDQTGFIPERYYEDNLRRALNIMSYTKSTGAKVVFLSLDAHKAFDRVSWQYLIHILKRFKFGPNFIKWIQTLYTNPLASVRVNGCRSGRFTLERGCRQGCPLSPLLFAISIETLAQLIRDDSAIKGIVIG